jgi:hypothetical protein
LDLTPAEEMRERTVFFSGQVHFEQLPACPLQGFRAVAVTVLE